MKVNMLSSFTAFELTPEEEKAAYEFNDCQIAGIQNLISGYAEDLVKVVLDTDEFSLEGAKKLAYTKGSIDALKYLLVAADTQKEQREQAEREAELNQ